MRSFLLIAALALTATSLQMVTAQAPIPYRPDGWQIGAAPGAPIVMDAFLDLLCPDCAEAWPTIEQLVKHYGSNLQMQLHTFPLPYHTNGFMAAQAAHACVKNGANAAEVSNFLFQQQASFWNGPTSNSTINEVQAQLGALLVGAKLITPSQYAAGMADPYLNNDVRVSWKYACSRGVLGTPTFMVNGVNVNGDPSWTLADWQTILDPLLQPPPSKHSIAAKAAASSLKLATKEVSPNEVTVKSHRRHHRKAVEAVQKPLCSPRPMASRTFVSNVADCPAGQPTCNYLPGKYECCRAGEMCIPNVGCRC